MKLCWSVGDGGQPGLFSSYVTGFLAHQPQMQTHEFSLLEPQG